MTAERKQRISTLYQAALELSASEQATFLAKACAQDSELLQEVTKLIAEDATILVGRPVATDLTADAQWTPGSQIGPYQIVSRIGEGGMGAVYKARDIRLGREVALKTAHAEFSGRFQLEARAISALNHANICTLHDIGPNYLVMELVEGDTLAALLKNGRLPMDKVLRYGSQIADALTAAHSKGITHRDLKPGNVMVTKAGVKVLDFGLAKFQEGSDPSTLDAEPLTARQTILGTPAYMAPEQLEGKPCDARTDIFALGLLLYELASGRRAFTGSNFAELSAAVLNSPPAPIQGVSPQFEHIVERCLAKEPDDRWQTARDVKLELDHCTKALPTVPIAAPAEKKRRSLLLPLAATAAAGALLAAGGFYFRGSQTEPTVSPLTSTPGREVTPSISPDGNQVAFAWNGEDQKNFDIYIKPIGPGNLLRLTTDPGVDVMPRWSPDGKWIAFLRMQPNDSAGVYVMPALGGLQRKLGDADFLTANREYFGNWYESLDWSPDGKWLVISKLASSGSLPGLALLAVDSGETRQLTSPIGDHRDRGATFAPDGHALAYWSFPEGELKVLPLSSSLEPRGPPKTISLEGIYLMFIPPLAWTADSKEILFSSSSVDNSKLWRVPDIGSFPAKRLTITGDGAMGPAISTRGNRMIYSKYEKEWNLYWLDLDNKGMAVGSPVKAFDSTKSEITPEFSPDGTKIAFASNRSGNDEIWVCLKDGSNCSAITSFSGPQVGTPRWSPDGNSIVFDVLLRTLMELQIVGSGGGKPKVLTKGMAAQWSNDGQWIYYTCPIQTNSCRIPSKGGEVRTIAEGRQAQESPDGKWLYYIVRIAPNVFHLFRIPTTGGEPALVLTDMDWRNYAALDTGVWYMQKDSEQSSLLKFYDFATKSTRTVHKTSGLGYAGLAVSPDRRRILFSQIDRSPNQDLMLVENFR